jgi:hypothetical protein
MLLAALEAYAMAAITDRPRRMCVFVRALIGID